MIMNPIIKCINIRKDFKIRGRVVEVLKGIDLEVYPGELVVIQGKSGEGKTVLQWILSGIDTPTSGEIMFEGIPYKSLTRKEISKIRRKKIGLIFQNFNLIPSWTALENVESALLNNNMSGKDKTKKASSLLEQLGLKDRLDNLPAELSAGQQERVGLARALINDPLLICGDEPTGNVDDEMARELLKILLSYVKGKNSAMVITTHGYFPGIDIADKLYHLKDGKLDITRQNKIAIDVDSIDKPDYYERTEIKDERKSCKH
jgi:putative ABC transport system ATP-binding protein